MKVTLLPHARERMELYDIPEDAVRSVLDEADELGQANFGRLYAQKLIGHRLIRIVYNQGTDGTVVITVMLRRRDSEYS